MEVFSQISQVTVMESQLLYLPTRQRLRALPFLEESRLLLLGLVSSELKSLIYSSLRQSKRKKRKHPLRRGVYLTKDSLQEVCLEIWVLVADFSKKRLQLRWKSLL